MPTANVLYSQVNDKICGNCASSLLRKVPIGHSVTNNTIQTQNFDQDPSMSVRCPIKELGSVQSRVIRRTSIVLLDSSPQIARQKHVKQTRGARRQTSSTAQMWVQVLRKYKNTGNANKPEVTRNLSDDVRYKGSFWKTWVENSGTCSSSTCGIVV